jgi:hypothetical protein
MTIPTQMDAACHEVSVLAGTCAVASGGVSMVRRGSRREILPRLGAAGYRAAAGLLAL